MYGKTQKDFVADLRKAMEDALEIVARKNTDYATESDPFKNFRFSKLINIDVEKAILQRVCDKMARVNNVIERGEVAVKDETVTDTLLDIINYIAILKVYLDWEKKLKEGEVGSIG